jgi:hypothetical protein
VIFNSLAKELQSNEVVLTHVLVFMIQSKTKVEASSTHPKLRKITQKIDYVGKSSRSIAPSS